MSGGVEHQHLEEAEDEFGSGRGFETLSASTPNHSDGNREIDSELRPGKSDLGDIKEGGGGWSLSTISHCFSSQRTVDHNRTHRKLSLGWDGVK